jgi:endonuclease/exonuclease/phosphatase family metal-dependent hydrolase
MHTPAIMRTKFLFWNIRRARGSRLAACLTRLAAQDIDVFLFAEAPLDLNPVAAALNSQATNQYMGVASLSSRVRFFARQSGPLVGAVWRDLFFDGVNDRITALECQPQAGLSLSVIGAHLNSPATGLSVDDRAEWARDVAADIQTVENDVGHKRTILVGDLNMNPFDGGLVQTTALHAVMTRNLTSVVARHQAREGFPVFYNPMWSCFGDRPAHRLQPNGRRRPPGTYYFDKTDARANTFWQMYDQVLLRPELMEQLTHLEILAGDGIEEFVTAEGKPRGDLISDHLPILFELNL